MINLIDRENVLRILEVDGKKYVLGLDLGKYFGYNIPSEPISRMLKGHYITESTILEDDTRPNERQLVTGEGVEILMKRTRKVLDKDKLSFLHNELIPALSNESKDMTEMQVLEEAIAWKDLKINSQVITIDELQNEIDELKKNLTSIGIEKKKFKMAWEDTEAYLENAERDLEDTTTIYQHELNKLNLHYKNELTKRYTAHKQELDNSGCVICRTLKKIKGA